MAIHTATIRSVLYDAGYGFLRPEDVEIRRELGDKDLFFGFSDFVLPHGVTLNLERLERRAVVIFILGRGKKSGRVKAIHWTFPEYRDLLEVYDTIIERRMAARKAVGFSQRVINPQS